MLAHPRCTREYSKLAHRELTFGPHLVTFSTRSLPALNLFFPQQCCINRPIEQLPAVVQIRVSTLARTRPGPDWSRCGLLQPASFESLLRTSAHAPSKKNRPRHVPSAQPASQPSSTPCLRAIYQTKLQIKSSPYEFSFFLFFEIFNCRCTCTFPV